MRRRLIFTFCVTLAIAGSPANTSRGDDPAIDRQPTHEQVALIKASRGETDPMELTAFCLSETGEIVACCGEGPGEIRVLDPDGQLLRAWSVPVKPEAVGIATDGTVLVGGLGKLFRYTIDGELLREADSPHAVAVRENMGKLREEAAAQLSRSRRGAAGLVQAYEQILDQLKQKQATEELRPQEERILSDLPQRLELLREQAAREESDQPAVNQQAIQQQVDNMARSKMRIASISANQDHVFITTPATLGYTFDVWRLDPDFQNGEVVVSGLRGCCGQMDAKASDTGLFVAENSRHRVVHYTPTGEMVTNWGKRDRNGLEGFSSCCNPMNVCFDQEGAIFTAESSTGRIKKYDAQGALLQYVGDVELVPGCKNVSIAVSRNGERVYMLDITRNHIVMMKNKAE